MVETLTRPAIIDKKTIGNPIPLIDESKAGEVDFGPFRQPGLTEPVSPKHISIINGEKCIPVRIYGSSDGKIKENVIVQF